jgi:NAD+ synthase (glutamine-hydrolysing)
MGDVTVGITICEDGGSRAHPLRLRARRAQLIVNLSASPFHVGKAEEREEMLVTARRDTSSFFAFCNLVGGQDELSSTGTRSCSTTRRGVARAAGFDETLLVVDLDPTDAIARRLRDVRRRELERSRERARRRARRARASPSQPDERRRHDRAVRARARADAARARLSALATTSRRTASRDVVVAVSGGIDSASRRALRRRARARARALRLDAVAYSSEGNAVGRTPRGRCARLLRPRDPDRVDGRWHSTRRWRPRSAAGLLV